jgi:hypothetical protein
LRTGLFNLQVSSGNRDRSRRRYLIAIRVGYFHAKIGRDSAEQSIVSDFLSRLEGITNRPAARYLRGVSELIDSRSVVGLLMNGDRSERANFRAHAIDRHRNSVVLANDDAERKVVRIAAHSRSDDRIRIDRDRDIGSPANAIRIRAARAAGRSAGNEEKSEGCDQSSGHLHMHVYLRAPVPGNAAVRVAAFNEPA